MKNQTAQELFEEYKMTYDSLVERCFVSHSLSVEKKWFEFYGTLIELWETVIRRNQYDSGNKDRPKYN